MIVNWLKCAAAAATLLGIVACGLLSPNRTVAAEADADVIPVPPTVQKLAREYRIEVYRSFRLDRPEFDRRRRVAAEVYSAWIDAGARPADVDKLAAWIREARAASTVGSIRPLPAPPEFGLPSPDATPRVALKPTVPGELDHAPNVRPRPPRAQGPDALGAQTVPAVKPRAAIVTPKPTLKSNTQAPPAAGPDRQLASVVVAPVTPPPPARIARGKERNPFPLDEKLDEAVEVNVVELEARIAGFNRALVLLENRLLVDKVRAPSDLAAMFAELDELIVKEGDLQLYLNLLEPTARRNVRAPQNVARAKELLRARIADSRDQTSAEFGNDPDELRSRTKVLDSLERRLKSEE